MCWSRSSRSCASAASRWCWSRGHLRPVGGPPAEAVQLLDEVRAPPERGVRCAADPESRGNHDGAERLGFGARQLGGARACTSAVRSSTNREPVILQGRPRSGGVLPLGLVAGPATVPQPARPRGAGSRARRMRAAHRRPPQSRRATNGDGPRPAAVLIAHCFLDGFRRCESERPLSIGGVETVPAECFDGFDYVALGHLHGPQARSAQHLRYSGSILKYSFSEENSANR